MDKRTQKFCLASNPEIECLDGGALLEWGKYRSFQITPILSRSQLGSDYMKAGDGTPNRHYARCCKKERGPYSSIIERSVSIRSSKVVIKGHNKKGRPDRPSLFLLSCHFGSTYPFVLLRFWVSVAHSAANTRSGDIYGKFTSAFCHMTSSRRMLHASLLGYSHCSVEFLVSSSNQTCN